MILVLDNYDSFVFNLARYFHRLGQETRVVRNDAVTVAEIERLKPDCIVISPGPCTPNEAGRSLEIVRAFHRELPMLGVCLGHQVIAQALGGTVHRSPLPLHGRSSLVEHDGRGIFTRLPNPFTAGRYHSLITRETTLPACLEVSARTADGVVMALRHRELPLVGLQFHPESVLTECGYALLAAFLRRAGLEPASPAPTIDSELAPRVEKPRALPVRPVAF